MNAVRDEETGCLLWQGELTKDGYAIQDGELVYRQIYVDHHGEIPEGYHIDHVYARGCRYRYCIEISHLEAVTRSENFKRGRAARLAGHRRRLREDGATTPRKQPAKPAEDDTEPVMWLRPLDPSKTPRWLKRTF